MIRWLGFTTASDNSVIKPSPSRFANSPGNAAHQERLVNQSSGRMLGLAPLLCSAYATGSRQAVSSRRCVAPRCSLLADLATAPGLADLASVPLLPGAAVLVAASVAGAAFATRPTGPVGAPYPADAKGYDPEAANAFYGARLPFVASRLLTLGSITLAFNVRLGLDYLAYKNAGAPEGEPWPNEKDRAKEALSLATQLGPTFIKLAQAPRTTLPHATHATHRAPHTARTHTRRSRSAPTSSRRPTRSSCASCRTPCPHSTRTRHAPSSRGS
jgi:hypothetical protein